MFLDQEIMANEMMQRHGGQLWLRVTPGYINEIQQSSIHGPVPRSSIHPNFIMHVITGTEDEA